MDNKWTEIDIEELKKTGIRYDLLPQIGAEKFADFPDISNLRSFNIIEELSAYFGSGTKAADHLNDIIRWMVEEVKLETNKALMSSINKRWLIEQYQTGFQNSVDVFSGNATTLKELREEYQKTLTKLKEVRYE